MDKKLHEALQEFNTPPMEEHIPNAETIAATEELEAGKGMGFGSVEDLMVDLNEDTSLV